MRREILLRILSRNTQFPSPSAKTRDVIGMPYIAIQTAQTYYVSARASIVKEQNCGSQLAYFQEASPAV